MRDSKHLSKNFFFYRGLLLALVFLCSFTLHHVRAQRVSIGLYDTCSIRQLSVRTLTEGYTLLLNGKLVELEKETEVRFSFQGRLLLCTQGGNEYAPCEHIALFHADPNAQFEVTLLRPEAEARTYDGNLSLFIDFGRIMCLNLVDQEAYIAGVALAEVGARAKPELYKAQALLIRTYLMGNRAKHLEEGFNLCDQVHCQAYKGSASKYPHIRQATQQTANRVVVDADGNLITSVFHANCGGQTAAARDVWMTETPYLQSVKDPYCRRSRGANWKKTVSLNDWKRFLQSKGVSTERINNTGYLYRSETREGMYELPGGIAVPFRDLREYFNLKSAWFNVAVDGGEVLLSGRGYGHGIGMCQEGAIRMAEEGKTAAEIINFYFRGARIVKLQ